MRTLNVRRHRSPVLHRLFQARSVDAVAAGLGLFALLSFSGLLVNLVAAGHPGSFAAIMAFPLLSLAWREWRCTPTPWCRVAPDPLTQDLRPVVQAIETAMARALTEGQRTTIALLPLVSPHGHARDYRVHLHTGKRPAPRAGTKAQPRMLHAWLPVRPIWQAPAVFTIKTPRGVHVRILPDDTVSGKPRLVHDADAAAPRGISRAHVGRMMAIALLCWNVGRHGPYAATNPTLPAWCAGVALILLLHHATRFQTEKRPAMGGC